MQMKKTGLLRIAIGVFMVAAVLSMHSCIVSKKKYEALNKRTSALEADKAACEENFKNLVLEHTALKKRYDSLLAISNQLLQDTTDLNAALRKTQANYEALNNTYERLLSTHNKIINYNASELEKLNKSLAKRELEVGKLQADLSERERRVNELEKIIADKERAVNELRNKVTSALLNYKDKDLTIQVKDGKVYVSLAEQLLFKSGSTDVDPKGVEALKKLAAVLKEQQDITIMVEGHTDDVPVSKGTNGIKDNWDLSVLRATSITRILTGAGVDPIHVVPAGHGEFIPVATAKTAEARSQNRRTEIILTPNLNELYKLLETTK
ncbi:OmpA family protein [Cytophaga hutchinsonii]|uniref:Outer membrane protein, OmpA family n=2 Tax=Cytophaga hutchinsonii TaxID=985 RepID=A0A6N4STW8_CYTH3|nr:OmpA family protein [Cytophaga hutchinsonii]ABG59881.1 outer membrane protein, OmpA family [Cytophaga hutchinsonii ATCC 33406]